MTNPTADAANLLPCPFCGAQDGVYSEQFSEHSGIARCSNCNATHCETTEAEAIAKWNTRPQPAPPAGEPDFAALACQIGFEHDEEWSELEISYGGGGRNINRERLIEIIKTLAERMYRLGLAARPKVPEGVLPKGLVEALRHQRQIDEDGEEVAVNRQACDEAANLLERLAGYLSDMTADFKDQAVKLAERDAELAKAYDVIAHTLTPTDCFTGDIDVVTAAHTSHAARQQQKESK